jgi:tetratricopeptide (TPR) repeat protein
MKRRYIPNIRKQSTSSAKDEKKLDVYEIDKKVSSYFRIAGASFTALLIGLFITLLLVEIFSEDNKIMIHPFSVPEKFEKDGLTSQAISLSVEDRIKEIKESESVKEEKIAGKHDFGDSQPSTNIQILGIQTQTDQLLHYIKELLGIQSPDIHGELAHEEDSLRITVRTSNKSAFVLTEKIFDNKPYQALQKLIDKTGIEILKRNEPLSLAYYYASDTAKFLPFICTAEKYSTIMNKDKAELYRIWGNYLANQGKYEEAETKYATALEYDAENIKLLNSYGIVLDNTNNHRGAIKMYKRILVLDPKYYIAWYNMGIALDSQNEKDSSVWSYRKALDIDPTYTNAWYGMAIVLDKLGKKKEAITSYKMALKIDPKYTDAWYGLALVWYSMKEKDSAIACYKKALEVNPNYINAWYGMALVLDEIGKHEAAITSYRQALTINPEFRNAWYAMGFVLNEIGKRDSSLLSFRRVLEIDPDYTDARNAIEQIQSMPEPPK